MWTRFCCASAVAQDSGSCRTAPRVSTLAPRLTIRARGRLTRASCSRNATRLREFVQPWLATSETAFTWSSLTDRQTVVGIAAGLHSGEVRWISIHQIVTSAKMNPINGFGDHRSASTAEFENIREQLQPPTCARAGQTIEFELEIWRRRPDLNRGWRFCRPLPYHLATAPVGTIDCAGKVRPRLCAGATTTARVRAGEDRHRSQHSSESPSTFALRATADNLRCAKVGAGNGIRTRDFDLGKVALYH